MKADELEPMSPQLRELLEAERPLDSVPAPTRAKLYGKLSATLGVAAVGAAAGHAVATGNAASVMATTKAVIAAVAFSVGGAVGAGVHAVVSKPPPPPPPIVLRVEVPVPTPPPAPTLAVEPEAPPPQVAMKPSPRVPAPAPAPKRSGELGAERSLIERARAALSRNEPAAALAALADHRREHPDGQLAEERTALQIIALTQTGRREDARALAAEFRAKWSQSLMMPAVDAASPRPP